MDIKNVLAILAVVGFFAVLTALFAYPIPQANSQMINTVVVALISLVSTVIGYYFGSSAGSAEKNKLLGVAGLPLTPIQGTTTLPGSEGGFIRLPMLAIMLLLSLICLVGCATTSTTPTQNDSPQVLAGKSLLAVKSTIVTAAAATDRMCTTGAMAADKCAMASTAYGQSRLAYDSAVDAYLLMIQGRDPAAFAASLQRVQSLAANLLQLAGGVN